VADIGSLADVEGIGDGTVLIAQEGESGSEPSLERFQYPGRIDRDGGDPLVADLG